MTARCPYPRCRQEYDTQAELDEHLIIVTRHDDPDHPHCADDTAPVQS